MQTFFLRPFSLLVKPAAADCNLRCEYCFYLRKRGLYPDTVRPRMSEATLERMIRGFLATDQPVHAFGWQGGEPTLMGLDFFKRVTALQEACGRPGARVSNGLQTNGTLLDDAWAEHLARYRFLVGVSLDGPPALHDRFRLTIDGRPTHALVRRGIEAMRRHGVEFNVLSLVNRLTVSHGAEIYRYLRDDLGVMHHQYIECVEFDANGALQPYAVGGEAWGDFLCAVFDEWIRADTRRVSVRHFDSILAALVDGAAVACTLARDCRQYLVVEHNGDIYPCDFFVSPEWRLGNLAVDSWADLLASPRYAEFGVRKARWNVACERCEYLRVCAGCCPKNRSPDGRDPSALSVLCAGWKRFFRHAMPAFEGLAAQIRRDRAAAEAVGRAIMPSEPAGRGPGRNDPCPCGSGRKFKKCCGAPSRVAR